jgi:hypothetical protein
MSMPWIKMRTDICDDLKVEEMAEITGLDVFGVVGRLQLLWSWVGSKSEDGVNVLTTDDRINRRVQCDNFATALRQVGWIKGEDKAITFVNFTEHNGATAKKRAVDAARMAKKRGCRKSVASDATKTRPEKRREEKSKSSPTENKGDRSASRSDFDWDRDCPPSLNTPGVRDAYGDFCEYRRERKLGQWKPTTIRTNLAKFEPFGPAAFVAAVEDSISNGWQGVFPPKGTARGSPGVHLNDQYNIKPDDPADDPLAKARAQTARNAG